MNNESRALVHAATGPIILITVGSLFALDKSYGYPFHQTWPVLIIVIGLLKLFGGRKRKYSYNGYAAPGVNPNPNPNAKEYTQPQPPPPPPDYGASYDPLHYNPSAPPPPPQPGVRQ